MLKSCATACETSCAILARRSLAYLIKERVVPPLDPGPVGLAAHMDLHYGFDVVSRQLTGLNDPNTNLRERGRKKKSGCCRTAFKFRTEFEGDQIHRNWSLERNYEHECVVTMKLEDTLPRSLKSQIVLKSNFSSELKLLTCQQTFINYNLKPKPGQLIWIKPVLRFSSSILVSCTNTYSLKY